MRASGQLGDAPHRLLPNSPRDHEDACHVAQAKQDDGDDELDKDEENGDRRTDHHIFVDGNHNAGDGRKEHGWVSATRGDHVP